MNERTLRARMLLGEEAMEKLAGSHVAVFGLGGVGSWCAEALARAGVGRLTLIDQDTVGESNINRQLCALGSTVGMGKAAVMAQRALDVNPDIDVKCIEGHYEAADRERFFGGYDYVVDAIDLVLRAHQVYGRVGSRAEKFDFAGTRRRLPSVPGQDYRLEESAGEK